MIALELLLTLASAVLLGLLLWLAVATWDDRGATGGSIVGVLIVVALAVGAGWFLWLTGVSGWLLAGASGVAGLQVAFLLVLGASGEATGVNSTVLLVSLGCAILGAACGVFLPPPSSRRYRRGPRVRASAGGAPSAPRVSPQVAHAADRYAKQAVAGMVAGAAAVTAAGARRATRSTATPDVPAAAQPEPVLQARPGAPTRTSGPSTPAAGTTATRSAARTAEAGAPPKVAGSPPATPATTRGTTPASGKGAPPAGTAASAKGAPPAGTPKPRQDPGAIARSGRASIDAELAGPPRAGTQRPPTTGSPGFRLVDPPPPMTRVKSASNDGPRFSPVDRPPPPRPPRGGDAR